LGGGPAADIAEATRSAHADRREALLDTLSPTFILAAPILIEGSTFASAGHDMDIGRGSSYALSGEARTPPLGHATTLLEHARAAKYLLLSNAGPHAREGWHEIIQRKSDDVAKVKHTVWVLNSNAARPDAVQAFCTEKTARFVLFVSRARYADVNVGPSGDQEARAYSASGNSWAQLERGLGPVTGHIRRTTTGLWIDALEEVSKGSLDLASFATQAGTALERFRPSDSTYPVTRVRPLREGAYHILAAGRLAPPYAVWLAV
jgi:hypothetical protein